MLKNSQLSKRIPLDVRAQYEKLYATLKFSLEDSIQELKKSIDEIERNPEDMKDIIHVFINQAVSRDKKN